MYPWQGHASLKNSHILVDRTAAAEPTAPTVPLSGATWMMTPRTNVSRAFIKRFVSMVSLFLPHSSVKQHHVILSQEEGGSQERPTDSPPVK